MSDPMNDLINTLSSDSTPAPEPTAEPAAEPASEPSPEPETDPGEIATGDAPNLEPDDSNAGANDGDEKPEPEKDAKQNVSIPADEYNRLLGLLAKHGIDPAAVAATDGETPPEPAVDQRNAIPGEAEIAPFEMTPEEIDALCLTDETAKILEPMFSRIAKTAAQTMERRVADITMRALSEGFGRRHVAERFYDDHPEYEQYGEIVNRTIATVRAQHPEYSARQIMGDTANILSALIPKAEAASKQLDAAKRGNPTGSRTPGVRNPAPDKRRVSPTEAAITGLSQVGAGTDPQLRKLGF